MFKNVIVLLRPSQWIKNSFIFLPLFFDGQIHNLSLLYKCIVVFVAYSFAASSIYSFNDIWDADADRQHPQKSKRPIASDRLSVAQGYLVMLTMFVASMATVLFLLEESTMQMACLILFYYLMNILYCTWLKHKALIDVFIIALGFVLRVVAGGIATGIMLSQWIIIMTFLLALFLALAKRRDDVVIYTNTGVKARKNVNRYNLDFMNQSISVIASIIVVAYIMYTVTPDVVTRVGSSYLYVTSLFVLLGILRYLQLTVVDVKSGSPTKVLMKDRFLQCCVVGWILLFIIILYI